jgi:hypothetical protein
VYVIREPAPAVDLDHRDPLPVGGLELGVAVDLDLAEVVAELGLERPRVGQGRLAQMATAGVVDDDLDHETEGRPP